ncbi:MAG: adenylate/guanylate cyclase domain-containing protein [Dehalococcoidia bacterium]
MGQGPVIVVARGIGHWNGIEGDLADPRRREMYEALAERHTLVRYDPRGLGLSQREAEDVSLAAHVADLAAVLGTVRVTEVVLWANGFSAAPVIQYAAQHPDAVRRLILSNGTIRGRERRLSEARRVIAPIFDYDFDLYVRVVYLMELGWHNGVRLYEATGSKAVSKDMLVRQWRECRSWDLSEHLPSIRCPTLVIHVPSPDGGYPVEAARETAAAIPDAIFRGLVWDMETVTLREGETVRDFLGEEGAPVSLTAAPAAPGMAVILFADIAGSTALTERIGDSAFREKARALDDALRIAVRDNGGAAIEGKLLGDGILATFPAASQGIDAALRCGAAGDAQGLPLHLGIHAGDVIREANNVFGGAVNIASRISGLSAPGEVLVSDTVRSLARTSTGVTFEDRGEHALKGIAEPVRVFAVRPGIA